GAYPRFHGCPGSRGQPSGPHPRTVSRPPLRLRPSAASLTCWSWSRQRERRLASVSGPPARRETIWSTTTIGLPQPGTTHRPPSRAAADTAPPPRRLAAPRPPAPAAVTLLRCRPQRPPLRREVIGVGALARPHHPPVTLNARSAASACSAWRFSRAAMVAASS